MAAPDRTRKRSSGLRGVLLLCPTCGLTAPASLTFCPQDGARLVAGGIGGAGETRVERVVGERYRLLGELGRGGMGTVYLAEQTSSGQRVAMKIIRPELESSAIARARFLRECETLERIESPYVVQVLDAGESPRGEIYLVMELLEGRSLGDRLDEDGPLPTAEALSIAARVAEAIAAAHAAGIVHRDLKPDNVFLCVDGSLRVVDFGIARLLDVELEGEPAPQKLTQTGSIIGTPGYIAPEQIGAGVVQPAGDLYSLGVLLFEMLTGELPLHDANPVLLMSRQLREDAPLLRAVRPERDFPEELEALVARLLRRRPEERPAGAAHVARLLAEVDPGRPASGAASPGSATRPVLVTAVAPALCEAPAHGTPAASPGIEELAPTEVEGDLARDLPSPAESSRPRAARLAGVALALLALAALGGLAAWQLWPVSPTEPAAAVRPGPPASALAGVADPSADPSAATTEGEPPSSLAPVADPPEPPAVVAAEALAPPPAPPAEIEAVAPSVAPPEPPETPRRAARRRAASRRSPATAPAASRPGQVGVVRDYY